MPVTKENVVKICSQTIDSFVSLRGMLLTFTEEDITEIMKAIPLWVVSLDLSDNPCEQFSFTKILHIIKSIPSHITELQLQNCGFKAF